MNSQRVIRIAAFIAVATIYIAARFWNLTTSCLWFDEIFSVNAAEHSWNSILNFVALDLIHPPLFYLILKLWIALGGESLFWLRTLPVAFSVLAIVPFALLCRQLRFSFWTSIFALLLMSVNGSLVKYSQELRMYSMLLCISLFSTWLFARYFNEGKGIAALTVVNLVLVYTHYFGWLVVVSEVLAILAFQRIKWRPLVLMVVVTAAEFLPWMVTIFYAYGSGSELSQNIGWMQRPGILGLVQLLFNLIEPFYFPATSIDPISVYRISIPLVFIAALALIAHLFSLGRRLKHQDYVVALLLFFFAVPLGITFAASWILPYSIWGTRHLIIVFVPFCLIVALALSRFPYRSIRTAGITLVMILSGYAFVIEAARPKLPPVWCGFEAIAKNIEAAERGPVYVFEDLAAYHLWFEFGRDQIDQKVHPTVIKVNDLAGMPEDKAYFIPRGLTDGYLVGGTLPLESSSGSMWIVYRARKLNITAPPLDVLSDHGFLIKRQEIYDGGDTKIIAVFVEKQ